MRMRILRVAEERKISPVQTHPLRRRKKKTVAAQLQKKMRKNLKEII